MNELWLHHQLGLEGIPYPTTNNLMELDPTHFLQGDCFTEEDVQWPVYQEAKGG